MHCKFIVISVAATLSGCGSSVEHIDESVSSPEFSAQRTVTRIRVNADESENRPVFADDSGQPIHLHVHSGGSICVEVVSERR